MFIDVITGKPITAIWQSLSKHYGGQMDADFIGGKAYGLHWMGSVEGVRVPRAFVLPTTLCSVYHQKTIQDRISAAIPAMMKQFKDELGYVPLVSVRSGAKVSCPGMMDTLLNVGIDATNMPFWIERLGEKSFNDSGKRLITMYADVVMGLDRHQFEACDGYASAMALYQQVTGEAFPDAEGQLIGAIGAVFKSWNNERAKTYRKLNNIPETLGTAVVVQQMVFGNLGETSCTGVLFTRNPDTGEDKVVGEFLVNAQGEDVVAGIRTPEPLSKMIDWNNAVLTELLSVAHTLEEARKDMQDIEFTVEDGKLYILQTRNAKRTPKAAVNIALDLHAKGWLSEKDMFARFSMKALDLAQVATIADGVSCETLAGTGIPACSGVISGVVVKSSDAAINCKEPCVLITDETTPDDIGGMNAAVAIVTMKGGSTSHAAVVARGMNRICVVGMGLPLDTFKEGDKVTVCGATGRVWNGVIKPSSEGGDYKGAVMEVVKKARPEAVWLDDCFDLVSAVTSQAPYTLPICGFIRVRKPTVEELSFFTLFGMDLKKELSKVLNAVHEVDRKNVTLLNEWGENLQVTGYMDLPITDNLEVALGAAKAVVWKGKNDLLSQRVMKFLSLEGVASWMYGEYVEGRNCLLDSNMVLHEVLQ